MRTTVLSILASLLMTVPAVAQDAVPDSTPADSADVQSILRALDLPNVADILRERGVPNEEIEAAIEGARQQDVEPGEMADAMEAASESAEENGPIENFGAFVQTQLESGLRGRELAEAIRAEHARRGIGPGNRIQGRGGPPAGRGPGSDSMAEEGRRGGPPEGRGPGAARGGPDADSLAEEGRRGGPPGNRGRPDSAGGGPDRGQSGNNGGNGGLI